MQGWIKLHRKFIGWEWYKDANVMRLFLHCLLKANHKDNNWQGNLVKKGSFITSLDTLSHELGLSVKQIRTAISKLEKTSEVAKKSYSKFTVIQIVNYEEYQEEGKQEDTQKANKGQGKGKQRATNNNDKKEKNEEETIKEIYSLYPTNCPVKGNSNDKGKANKEQIKRILKSKEETVDSLKAKIERYVRECKNSNTYLKNFKTFLNNLPDYSEEEKKDELKEENIYLWIKKQLEEEPKKTFNSSYINSLRHKEMKLTDEEFKELSKMNNLKAERLRFAK